MPEKRPYTKKHTPFSDQVKLLQSRGIHIHDPAEVESIFHHVNYYRLSGYWLPFETNHDTHQFHIGTSFDDIYNLYLFDQNLRLLLLEGISTIEISLRCQWSYILSRDYGPHAHVNPELANNRFHLAKNLETLYKELERSNELFIKHFSYTYQEKFPPIWASSEIMSFGLLSRFYDNLKPMPLRKAIASVYAINDELLESWIRHLTSIRNYAAHQARIWNRDFTIIPAIPKSDSVPNRHLFNPETRRLYNGLLIISHLLQVIAPENNWRKRIAYLIKQHSIDPSAMGFPANWQTGTFWT